MAEALNRFHVSDVFCERIAPMTNPAEVELTVEAIEYVATDDDRDRARHVPGGPLQQVATPTPGRLHVTAHEDADRLSQRADDQDDGRRRAAVAP